MSLGYDFRCQNCLQPLTSCSCGALGNQDNMKIHKTLSNFCQSCGFAIPPGTHHQRDGVRCLEIDTKLGTILSTWPPDHDLTGLDYVSRSFSTGATRDTDQGKPDYEGFLSPLVIKRFGEYMLKHQTMPDGSKRASDNWQKGIPREQYLKSMMRHLMDVWLLMRDRGKLSTTPDLEEALAAVLFNVQGLLHEVLLKREVK